MSGKGSKVRFHGAFGTKAKAKAKERRVTGAYIERKLMRGGVRYLVLTRKRGK